MTKRDAVRLANRLAGLRPRIVQYSDDRAGKWAVEYSRVAPDQQGRLVEYRERETEARR